MYWRQTSFDLLFNQCEFYVTIKLYHNLPKVSNIMLKPRAFKRSSGLTKIKQYFVKIPI